MRILFILLSVAAVSFADVLWEWDLSQLPSGWTANDYWDFSGDSTHSLVSALTSGPGSYSETALMRSDSLTIPPSVDTIVVYAEDEWEWDGWCASGESNCCIWLKISIVGGDYHTIEFDSHSWGFLDEGQRGNSAQVQVPVEPGSVFYVEFYSYAGSSYGAYAKMIWWVDSLVITDTSGTSLNHSTWGAIKTSI